MADFQKKKAADEAELETIMEGLRGSTQELRAQLEQAQVRLAEAEKAVAVLQSESESVSMASKLQRTRAEQAQQEVVDITEKISKFSAEKAAAEKLVVELEAEASTGVALRAQSLRETIAQCEQQEIELQKQLRAAVIQLEESRAAMQSGAQGKGNTNTLVDKIVRAAAKGGCLAAAGVRGRYVFVL
jgi:chromosome segregation ATPase